MKQINEFIRTKPVSNNQYDDYIDYIAEALAYPGTQEKMEKVMRLALAWLENPEDTNTLREYCKNTIKTTNEKYK